MYWWGSESCSGPDSLTMVTVTSSRSSCFDRIVVVVAVTGVVGEACDFEAGRETGEELVEVVLAAELEFVRLCYQLFVFLSLFFLSLKNKMKIN